MRNLPVEKEQNCANRFENYLNESIRILQHRDMMMLSTQLADVVKIISDALLAGRPLLVCGNGGSAADAMHITGELVGRFLHERQAIRCYCLSCNSCVLTAWSNDYDFDSVFARQVEAYGESGGILLGLSTTGNSNNVVSAFQTGKRMGLKTIALTGLGGGRLALLADHALSVPSQSTPLIQQAHMCLYHHLCAELEERFRHNN